MADLVKDLNKLRATIAERLKQTDALRDELGQAIAKLGSLVEFVNLEGELRQAVDALAATLAGAQEAITRALQEQDRAEHEAKIATATKARILAEVALLRAQLGIKDKEPAHA